MALNFPGQKYYIPLHEKPFFPSGVSDNPKPPSDESASCPDGSGDEWKGRWMVIKTILGVPSFQEC